MGKTNDELEALWDALLSRQEELIQQAFTKLDRQDQQAIINHLKRIVSEPGWQPEQVTSARIAL